MEHSGRPRQRSVNLYIYILSSTDRSVSFYQNSSVWLHILDSCSWDRNPVDSNTNPRFYPLSQEETSSSEVNFKRLWITITIVYIYLLNGYRELNSSEEPCIYANDNAITSFARELNSTVVGGIYILSIYNLQFLRLIYWMTLVYIYIYIRGSINKWVGFCQRNCHHHHHIALVVRISLTLSRHSSLSFIALGRSSGQHPVSSHSCWIYVRAGRPAFARPCVGVHKSTFLMSSSLEL